jgi:hypothetical protein
LAKIKQGDAGDKVNRSFPNLPISSSVSFAGFSRDDQGDFAL